jgi:hypothetical protein
MVCGYGRCGYPFGWRQYGYGCIPGYGRCRGFGYPGYGGGFGYPDYRGYGRSGYRRRFW